MKNELSRRQFIQRTLGAGVALAALNALPAAAMDRKRPKGLQMGLVTYMWGAKWDLPTLISNCEKSGLLGVELRTQHAHKVEIDLTPAQRKEVKKRFADSPVTCVGYGSNYEFHSPDPARLRENIEGAKEYVKLCKDIGATGLKVKPNTLPKEVEREKTIAQIARSLNELGKFARDYGQIIRVECHGPVTQEIPNMKAIFDQVTEKNVKMCWNSNDVDLNPPGLEANFNSVRQWIGDTTHIRGIKISDYPYEELFRLLHGINYRGWILVEATTPYTDPVAVMREQLTLFNEIMDRIKS
ncbi:MAG TPA: sugar phosphate isomerase/epimerase family protein [Bacteroidales bacterium]|jgi:sugar phosphate isomerase/epimerase|nr:sugar phosphate isomerase/epimerase family protein [Bacteroidales bacterium]HOS72262.1 sugar phosphate isomerase/epimerase family protein [Bacteroidales bacterium]HQH22701.1 sugar phosphate isomerase/epimerase family protein [Bacteroidales bacterium]HQJ82085.1 sugar phosphate isomerase/epimerase family protein [Bacteroidales bacterium]